MTKKGTASAVVTNQYTESVSQPVGPYVSQLDLELSDLFDSNGQSELCGPAALAQGLIYLRSSRQPHFSQLHLEGGLLADETSVDANAMIRSLARRCHSDPDATDTADMTNCIAKVFQESGYSANQIKLISPNADQYELVQGPQKITRMVTIDDLKEYVQKGYAVIASVAGLQYDPLTGQKNWSGAHYVSVVGYNYKQQWQSSRLEIKLINPQSLQQTGETNFITQDAIVLQGQGSELWQNFTFLYGKGLNRPDTSTVLSELLVFLPEKNADFSSFLNLNP